jgi:hypothetical protein
VLSTGIFYRPVSHDETVPPCPYDGPPVADDPLSGPPPVFFPRFSVAGASAGSAIDALPLRPTGYIPEHAYHPPSGFPVVSIPPPRAPTYFSPTHDLPGMPIELLIAASSVLVVVAWHVRRAQRLATNR